MVGKVCISLETCGSTNYFLRDMAARNEAAPGTVVYTWNQTAGRGQRGRAWADVPGESLAFSVLLAPEHLPAAEQYLMNMAIAVAAAEAVAGVSGAELRIKWPNDLLVRDRKVAGILIEAQLSGSSIQRVVAGIGINVYQAHFPPDLPDAVSLLQATGTRVDAGELVQALCRAIGKRMDDLHGEGRKGISAHYHRLLYARGEVRVFEAEGRRFCGTITGVDSQGRLRVLTDGEERAYVHGQIRWV